MRLSIVREDLMKVGTVAGGIALVALLITGYSFYDRQSREDELAKTQRDTSLAKNQIVKLQQENDEFIKMQLRYNRIPDNKRDSSLNDLPSRIALLQPLLQTLKVRYRMPVLDISLTNVAPFVTVDKQTKYDIMFNTVTLNFGGLSDELILSFLEDLYTNMPGFVRVETLEMKRNLEITPAVMAQLQGHTIPVLVSGRVVFSWKTVKKK